MRNIQKQQEIEELNEKLEKADFYSDKAQLEQEIT